MKKKVLVAMSGGVDSSVTAALLKDEGYEAIGVTMQLWPRDKPPPDESSGCCGIDALDSAKRVAHQLNIPHYVLNFRDVFKKKVIDNFCTEYKEGRTPNPCIRCNQHIKFAALLKKTDALDIDYLATGHYARIEYDKERQAYLLKKGVDASKDQSYFLYVMTQQQLHRIRMPLGNLTKERVKQIARKKGLRSATRPESQEICFIPDNDYGTFLKECIPESVVPGPIKNTEGKTIGEHKGILFYTVGQRRGMGIAAQEPLYVIGIDSERNTIIAGSRKEGYCSELIARDINLVNGELDHEHTVEAKIRYLSPSSRATVIPLDGDSVRVKFDRPQWAITPGQSVVFYRSEEVLGGAIITATRIVQ